MTDYTLLSVKNLSVTLPTVGGKRTILDGIDFSLARGTMTAIIGKSGCGKSTLCKALLGFLGSKYKISGCIEFCSPDGLKIIIDPAKSSEFESLRGRHIGIVFQESALSLNPVLTIGRQVGDLIPDSNRRAVLWLLEKVGFHETERIFRAYPHELSGGQAQRVGLALALAPQPELLIVDEPATALDSIARRDFFKLLRTCQTENGLTILMVTHDLLGLADSSARLIVMSDGRIAEQGDSQKILENPQHPDTKIFLEIHSAMRSGHWSAGQS